MPDGAPDGPAPRAPGGRRTWAGRLIKAAIVVAFATGLSLAGAALTVFTEEECGNVPFLAHCDEARWAMAVGAVLAVGSLVLLWRRTVRKGRP